MRNDEVFFRKFIRTISDKDSIRGAVVDDRARREDRFSFKNGRDARRGTAFAEGRKAVFLSPCPNRGADLFDPAGPGFESFKKDQVQLLIQRVQLRIEAGSEDRRFLVELLLSAEVQRQSGTRV